MQITLNRQKCLQNAAVVFLLVVFLGAAASFAQLPTATILGVVRDGTGAVIPDTTLTARNVETGQTRTTVSASDGSYRFSAMPVGNYEVQVQQAGFQTAVQTGLRLTVGQEAVVNFTLQVGAVEQRVEVSAEAPLVNTTTSSLGGLVDEQKVADLPLNGRNYVDLALLQTGVQKSHIATGGGSIDGVRFSSNGAPLTSNNSTLDGARLNSFSSSTVATAASGNTLGVEGIQEFRVVTNALRAEYGMAMGSQIMIVSKTGTNSFHGSLFEYHRNDNLDARNFFDYGMDDEVDPKRVPPFVRNQFGGALGGPISQDKTFFHANVEILKERLSESRIVQVIPDICRQGNVCFQNDDGDHELSLDGAGNPIPTNPTVANWLDIWPVANLSGNRHAFNPVTPVDQYFGQVRIDHTFSENDTMFTRYTVDDSINVGPRDLPGVGSAESSRAQYLTFSETHVVSPTVINQARFSYSRHNVAQLTTYPDPRFGQAGPGFSLVEGKPLGEIAVGDLDAFNPRTNEPLFFEQDIFTWSNDVFWTAGAHALKFGVLINKFQQFLSLQNDAIGVLEFPDTETFLLGVPELFRAATPGSEFDRDYRFTTLGFYFQDDWRVRPSFTLNLGLRYEFSTQVNEVSGHDGALRNITDSEGTRGIPFENSTKRNISPRFGFAWDVTGNAMTSVRGGFGFLYDLGNMGTAFRYGTLNPPFGGLSALEEGNFAQPFAVPIVFPPGSEGRTQEVIDFHLKQPRVYQWNLTVERQLPADISLTVGYVGTRGVRLFGPREANPRVPTIVDGQRFWPGPNTGGERAPRVSDNWDDVIMMTTGAGSWYNALQVGFSKRLSSGLQFQNSYTWSHTMDDVQGQFQSEFSRTSSDLGADPGNMRYDWNPAAFDYRHNFVSNVIYSLPNFGSSGGMGAALLNGWRLSNILTLNTGFPITIVINRQWANSGIRGTEGRIDRPNLIPDGNSNPVKGVTAGCAGIEAGQKLGGPDRYFDPCQFELQPPGFKGNTQRGGVRGPGFATLDFSVMKETPLGFLGESGAIQFRAEFFNILNRPNFQWPERRVFTGKNQGEERRGNAGIIQGTLSTSRQIQLALKLVF